MAALTGGLASQASNASIAASTSTGVEEHNKIKLRLCYNGRFQQTASQNWKFLGGEYFNESISYGTKYADFMFKLSEKFKTAVSVKYQAPGEELDPDSLISVQDDADLQELMEDYLAHLERPGTPFKTFRIKVFVFMAAEEPLTPDEIMEGQSFFSLSHTFPPRVRAYRGLDGRSSWGSTLSSTGTPCTRQQDGSTGDWVSFAGHMPSNEGAADLQQLSRSAEAAAKYQHLSAEVERAALYNVRQSVVNYPLSSWVAAQQTERVDHATALTDEVCEYGNDETEAQEDDEQNIEEVLAAIQQEQQAAAAAVASGNASAPSSRLHGEASFPEDPFQQGIASPRAEDGANARQLQTLPSHISAFGEDGSDMQADGAASVVEAAGVAVLDALDAASQLPSHISAFGDDLGSNLQEVCAALVDGEEVQAEGVTNGGGMAGRMAAPYGGPRTQDSCFSLDGDAAGGAGGGQERAKPDRQDSGDSLASLPKLANPVHRLAKPDLKIINKIGEGAFGEVSVANAPLYGTVAVKWLKSERFGKHFASFGREAAMLADLNHPNVLRFYGVVTENATDNTVIGIMTEYIRGGSLSGFLRMSRTLLPLRTRCELALAAANGLAYLHELRIVHFDLKPDNLLLDAPPAVVRAAAGADLEEPVGIRINQAAAGAADSPYHDYKNSSSNGGGLVTAGSGAGSTHSPPGGRNRLGRSSSGRSSAAVEYCEVPVVKVADFGLSKHKLNSTYVSSCRDLRGTLPYMAPELVADPERVSEKADVWSLGVVMWEMLTREIPFQEYAPQQILMGLMCGNLHLDIPEWCEPEWRGLLEACLEPNPGNRPSMRELARQLEAIRDQQVAQEQQQLREEQQQQQLRRTSQPQQQQVQQSAPAQQQEPLQVQQQVPPQPVQQVPPQPAQQVPPQPVQQVPPQPVQQVPPQPVQQVPPQPVQQVPPQPVQQVPPQPVQQVPPQPVQQVPPQPVQQVPPQPVQQLQHQMQQLFAQPAAVQPPAPPPVALLQRQQQQQHVQEQQLLSQRHLQEQQLLSQRHQVQQEQLQSATIACLKQQITLQHQAVAQPAAQGINLSAHAGVMAVVHHAAAGRGPGPGPGSAQLGLQHTALQAAALAVQQQEQLQLQQACGLLQPPQPLQLPRPPGLGYIQPT